MNIFFFLSGRDSILQRRAAESRGGDCAAAEPLPAGGESAALSLRCGARLPRSGCGVRRFLAQEPGMFQKLAFCELFVLFGHHFIVPDFHINLWSPLLTVHLPLILFTHLLFSRLSIYPPLLCTGAGDAAAPHEVPESGRPAHDRGRRVRAVHAGCRALLPPQHRQLQQQQQHRSHRCI